jgi:hypothetical protein
MPSQPFDSSDVLGRMSLSASVELFAFLPGVVRRQTWRHALEFDRSGDPLTRMKGEYVDVSQPFNTKIRGAKMLDFAPDLAIEAATSGCLRHQ